jgi:hypothetical protein
MIVDDDKLDIREALSKNALETFLDIRFVLVAGDDDAG